MGDGHPAPPPPCRVPEDPVLSPQDGRVVAAFDFDGTITRGGSLLSFLRHVGGWRATAVAVAVGWPRLLVSALRGGRDPAKEQLVGWIVSGMEAESLADLSEDFARSLLRRKLRPEMRRRIDWHRSRGDQVVIVSASPAVYVEPAGRQLGVDGVIATDLEVDANGRFTGRFRGRNCRGAEKATRLTSWLRDRPARVWAYGNSRGDNELLAMADVAVRVRRFSTPDMGADPVTLPPNRR